MYLVTSDNKNFLRVFDRKIANRLADNIGGTILSTIKPIEISIVTRQCESTSPRGFFHNESFHVATFNCAEGIKYAAMNNLKIAREYKEIFSGDYYVVICGDVLLRVDENDFPEIKRKIA